MFFCSSSIYDVNELTIKGFSECIQAIQYIGLIDTEPHSMLHPNGPEITWVSI